MLEAEALAVQQYGRASGVINESDITATRAIADRLRCHGLGDLAAALLGLIPPVVPQLDVEKFGWDEMAHWLEHQYFPYYGWSSGSGHVELTEAAVAAFEEWTLRNYDDLTWVENVYGPLALSKDLRTLVGRGLTTVCVVVDAMSWQDCLKLQAQLVKDQVATLQLRPILSPVPTLTDPAKPSMVRGQRPDQMLANELLDSNYEALFAKNMSSDAHPKLLVGRSGKTTLSDLTADEADLYLYFYDDLDANVVHSSYASSIRLKRAGAVMVSLAGEIGEAMTAYRTRFGRPLALVLTSDHGYTELPKDCPVVKIPASKTDHQRVAHAGVASTVGYGLGELAGDKTRSDLFVAPGYQCFASRPTGAAHGGITPQELVIPLALYDPTSPGSDEYAPPTVSMSGKPRRGFADNGVVLTVVNVNPSPLTIQSVTARLCTVTELQPLFLGAGEATRVEMSLDARRVTTGTVDLPIALALEYLGEAQEFSTILSLPTTGAATADSDFESQFD